LGSTPRVDGQGPTKGTRRLTPIEGMAAQPDRSDSRSAPFLPRCRVSVAACQARPPEPRQFGAGHWASCLADLAP